MMCYRNMITFSHPLKVGSFLAMQITFVGYNQVQTSEHMAAIGELLTLFVHLFLLIYLSYSSRNVYFCAASGCL